MAEETLFTDAFDGALDPDWDWLRPKEGGWRLAGDGLEIRVEPGVADTVQNALLRAAPDRSQGTYAIEVDVFKPRRCCRVLQCCRGKRDGNRGGVDGDRGRRLDVWTEPFDHKLQGMGVDGRAVAGCLRHEQIGESTQRA